MRQRPKRPEDYVRCGWCKRLTEKKNASRIAGRLYGRECAAQAMNNAEQLARDLTVEP